MKKNARRPISARPRRGPTTAPAIHALLLLFSSSTSGGAGVGVLVDVEAATVDERLAEAEEVLDLIATSLRQHVN
jgi:hypothetical protein